MRRAVPSVLRVRKCCWARNHPPALSSYSAGSVVCARARALCDDARASNGSRKNSARATDVGDIADPEVRMSLDAGTVDKEASTDPDDPDVYNLGTAVAYYNEDGSESFRISSREDFENFDFAQLEEAAGISLGDGAEALEGLTGLDDLDGDQLDFDVVLDAETGEVRFLTEKEAAAMEGMEPGGSRRRHGGKSDSEPSWMSGFVNEPAVKTPVASDMGADWDVSSPVMPKHERNKEKPGMQRRLAMLEAEMTRIVTRVTGTCADWSRLGLDVDTVALAANLRELTVLYYPRREDLGADLRASPTGTEDERRSRKRCGAGANPRDMELNALRKDMERRVRMAIAADMDLKYAPRVRFRKVEDAIHGSAAGTKSEIDALFAQIAQERAQKSG